MKSLTHILLLLLLLSACQAAAPDASPTQPTADAAPTSDLPTSLPATLAPTTLPPALDTPTSTLPVTATQALTVTQTQPIPVSLPDFLPILTAAHQNLTYGPGQVIVAFAQGFPPGEDVAVALLHESQGVLFNKSARADALGNVQSARRLKLTPGEKDGLPAGRYTYQFTSASQSQSFHFQVDYGFQPAPAEQRCGYYPEQAVFEGALAFFCRGLKPSTPYTLITRQGEAIDAIVTSSDPFGLLLFPLRLTSKTLTPGDWLFSLGETTTQAGQPLETGIPSLSIHILSSSEVP